jgi:hypothetical protein
MEEEIEILAAERRRRGGSDGPAISLRAAKQRLEPERHFNEDGSLD